MLVSVDVDAVNKRAAPRHVKAAETSALRLQTLKYSFVINIK